MLTSVTVVIPTRNRRHFLPEAVDSVLKQQGQAIELVIVDNGSTDGTREYLSTLNEPTIRTLRVDGQTGRAVTCNAAIPATTTELVMFLDDDDWLWPGALTTLSAALRGSPHAVAAIGARWEWFTHEHYERRDAHPRIARTRMAFEDLLFGWSAPSGQVLYRTDVLRTIGGFRPEFERCEDRDLLLRLARLGPFVLRPETVMTYRWHENQTDRRGIRDVREAVAQQAIRSLPAAEQSRALAIRASGRWFDSAQDAFARGRYVSGLTSAARAAAAAPSLFLSPLVGPLFVRRLAGRVWRRLAGR